ncbi:MAG: aminoacyl-tRNA hydrolase [Spirochaetaceae bacterium]|jgi:PTH1 family peptidyl-tRNA hydrolase|nr:aminoacyl-tRNA hydrolase [Spirochaetaceae bacterium]
MVELAVFLGNPGREYAGNRHNVGRLLAFRLPFYGDLRWRGKFKGLYADMDSRVLVGGPFEGLPPRFHFLMPETYMNLSGDSVEAAASFFKIPPEHILVVHDELELPLGTLSLKFSGGLGGHNGLRSLKARLGAADFWRLRIGIGRPDDRAPGEGGPPGSGRGIIDWVLSDFAAPEKPALEQTLEAAVPLFTGALASEPESLLPEWKKRVVV